MWRIGSLVGGICVGFAAGAAEIRYLEMPPYDKRSIGLFTLENGVDVLAASAANYSMSFVQVHVNSGSLQDPPEAQGLAHYTEHVLCMGTKSFPKEDDFERFTKSHGGYHNAYTTPYKTAIVCSVDNAAYGEAVERLSSMVYEPSFTMNTTKEIDAVHAELVLSLQREFSRISFRPGRAYNRFSYGSRRTLQEIPEALGRDIRQLSRDYFAANFCGRNMRVLSVSNATLEEQRDTIAKWFERVSPDNEGKCLRRYLEPRTPPQLAAEMYKPEFLELAYLYPRLWDVTLKGPRPALLDELQKALNREDVVSSGLTAKGLGPLMLTSHSERQSVLLFRWELPVLPADKEEAVNPYLYYYWAYSFRYSLSEFVSKKGLGDVYGYFASGPECSSVVFVAELSELGEKRLDEVVLYVMTYVNELRQATPSAELFESEYKSSLLDKSLRETSSEGNTAGMLGNAMMLRDLRLFDQIHPPDVPFIKSMLEAVKMEDVYIGALLRKTAFPPHPEGVKGTSGWYVDEAGKLYVWNPFHEYSTEYSRFNETFHARLVNSTFADLFAPTDPLRMELPKPVRAVPEKLVVFNESSAGKVPELLTRASSANKQLWWRGSGLFPTPKFFFTIESYYKDSLYSPESRLALRAYAHAVHFNLGRLREHFPFHFVWHLNLPTSAWLLFDGVRDQTQMRQIVIWVGQAVARARENMLPSLFRRWKHELLRDLESERTMPQSVFDSKRHVPVERIRELLEEDPRFQSYEALKPLLEPYKDAFVLAYGQGMSREELEEVTQLYLEHSGFRPALTEQDIFKPYFLRAEQTFQAYARHPSALNANISGTCRLTHDVHTQVTFEDSIETELLSSTLHEDLFAKLRTQKQLGYEVGGWATSRSVVLHLNSPKLNPAQKIRELRAYEATVRQTLAELSDAELDKEINAKRNEFKKPPANSLDEFWELWKEISNLELCFDRKRRLIAHLDKLQATPGLAKEMILRAWDRIVGPDNESLFCLVPGDMDHFSSVYDSRGIKDPDTLAEVRAQLQWEDMQNSCLSREDVAAGRSKPGPLEEKDHPPAGTAPAAATASE